MFVRSVSNRGVTLMELLAAIAGVGFLLIASAHFIRPMLSYFQHPMTESEMLLTAEPVVNNLLSFLKGAMPQSVQISSSGGLPYSQITFQRQSGQDNLFHTYRFAQNGSRLEMTVDNKTPAALVDNVRMLAFSIPDGPADPYTVSVSLLLQSVSAGGQTSTVFLQRQIDLLQG